MALTVSVSAVTRTTATIGWSGNTRENVAVRFSSATPSTTKKPLADDGGIGDSGSIMLRGLAPGIRYTYNVLFYGGGATVSRRVTFTTTEPAPPPAAPDAPTGVNTSGITRNSIRLNWTKSTGATSYEVRRDSGRWNDVGDVASYRFTSLSANTTYTLSVRAKNRGGTSAAVEIDATTLAAPAPRPAAPTGLNSSGITQNSIRLNWTKSSGATSYEVRRGNAMWSDVGDVAMYEFTGLSANTAYNLQVRAKNQSGTSSAASIMATTLATPPVIASDEVIYRARAFEWRVERDGEDDLILTDEQLVAFRFDHGALASQDQYPQALLSNGSLDLNSEWTDIELLIWESLQINLGTETVYDLDIDGYRRDHDRNLVTLQLRGHGAASQEGTVLFSIDISPTSQSKPDVEIFPEGVLTAGERMYGLRSTGYFDPGDRQTPATVETNIVRLARDWERFAFAVVFEDCRASDAKYTAWKLPLTASSTYSYTFDQSSLIIPPLRASLGLWKHDAAQRRWLRIAYQNQDEVSNNNNHWIDARNDLRNGAWFLFDETSIRTSQGRIDAHEFHSWVKAPKILGVEYNFSSSRAEHEFHKPPGPYITRVDGTNQWRVSYSADAQTKRGYQVKNFDIQWFYWEADEERRGDVTVKSVDDSVEKTFSSSAIPAWSSDNEQFEGTDEHTKIVNVVKLLDDWQPTILTFDTAPNRKAELLLRAGDAVRINLAGYDHVCRIMRIGERMKGITVARRNYVLVVLNPTPAAAPELNRVTLQGEPLSLDDQVVIF